MSNNNPNTSGILSLGVNDWYSGHAILKNVQKGTTRNGATFLKCRLGDATGEVEGKYWDYNADIGPTDAGKAVWVEGRCEEYNGALQLIIQDILLAGPNDTVDLERLVPKAPINLADAMSIVRNAIGGIGDPDYRVICEKMLDRHGKAFRNAPAALVMHHAFVNGLLMHTTNMMRLAKGCSIVYSDLLDADLLIAATFLHDFGKLREFLFSDLGLVSDYSKDGQLLGHLVMGVMEIDAVAKEAGIPAEKALLLEHLIASHHGKPEFGAAVAPKCPEAEILPYIDMIDSRLEMYREAYADIAPGSFSTQKVFGLDNKKILRVK